MLSLVLPCRDEEKNVARFEAELFPVLQALGPYEVVAVDDGSRDGTKAALEALSKKFPVKIASHPASRGLGAALRAGFAAASGDRIATLDADLTFDPKDLARLLKCQEETGADLVSGSPFIKEDGLAGVPWARRLPSFVANAFYRGLIGPKLTAYTSICRLYRAAPLKSLDLTAEGFEINAEIASRFVLAGRPVAEIPCRLTTRTQGASKLSALPEIARHLALIFRLIERGRIVA